MPLVFLKRLVEIGWTKGHLCFAHWLPFANCAQWSLSLELLSQQGSGLIPVGFGAGELFSLIHLPLIAPRPL